MILLDIIREYLDTSRPLLGVEVGVSQGRTSAALLKEFPSLHLWMVDSWTVHGPDTAYRKSIDIHARLTAEQQERHYAEAIAATTFAADRRTILREPSVVAASRAEDRAFDVIFVDAEHTLFGVLADLEAWHPKLRPGGLLCGHDWDHPKNARGLWGVNLAVEQFASERRLRVRSRGDIWWYEP